MRLNLRHLFCSLVCCLFFVASSSAQFVNFEDTWREFLANAKTSNISKLTKPPKDQPIDFAKWALMYANTNFCSGDISSAQNRMEDVASVGETKYNTIPGFKEKYEDLAVKIKAYHQIDRYWTRFLINKDVSLEKLEAEPDALRVCEKGTLAKTNYMMAHAHYCNGDMEKAKTIFEKRVLTLAEKTSLKVEDVEGLKEEVDKMKLLYATLPKLDKAWAELVESDVSPGFEEKLPLMKCNPVPTIKAYTLIAAADICNKGDKMLKKITKLRSASNPKLDADLKDKLKWLETEVEKYNGDVAVLNKAWKEFVPSNDIKGGIKFGYEYCEIEDRIKAYVMVGMVHVCDSGVVMLGRIGDIVKEQDPELSDETLGKFEDLYKASKSNHKDLESLNEQWAEFIENNDTIPNGIDLADVYCDKIAQVKSWTIQGHFDACKEGQRYLDKIDGLQEKHELEFDEELGCRVLRLRGKVYQCRYIELVMQARKETHAERERFGPQSSSVMQGALNSDKQPCETKVRYSPLGNIGIKYIISTYLCQEIDLAKMGDPEYYKKIASWVDGEVLQKYCEESMRCKEDFFIYLEGHTDGNPFNGARYKKSLDIPLGTSFTHFLGDNVENKETTREITTSLKSNMELGIARAWTVKQQLDFMGVPISIGAYEHPKSERGGEFRRIEIELNITNLLLDFYEKRLKQLVMSSGIGERPEEC